MTYPKGSTDPLAPKDRTSRPARDRLAAVASRLPDACDRGEFWSATCPLHDGKPRNVTLRLSRDERILVECTERCSGRAIIEKVGGTIKDLFPPMRVA